MDLSTKLPADSSSGWGEQQPSSGGSSSSSSSSSGARLVVGSLDVNVGAVLPAEELMGQLPNDVSASSARAYLSNVCVAGAVRRHGVARRLMAAAEARAAAQGVRHLYVHVVADNEAAARLYVSAGFEVEAEESEAYARALQRPRRRILHKRLSEAVTD